MSRIAVFVDVQNIYYTTREAFGRQFDYRKFWAQLSERGDIVIAHAYAIERDDNGQIKFQDALRHIGFDVKLKPFIQRADGSAKGDWDVGITIDVLEAAPEVDEVVLLSGDGDFSLLLSKISSKYNIQTKVFGVPSLTAKSLIDSCNEYIEINNSLLR
ncbi:NYN domain-containing protein [Parashewanella curva]|uniref:NYN domain-containing protein n=1 Tax=Parashewanella curva TaxID=2338552 RepID=A0A3L8PVZ3_9GAMM|nr:NYN domain-containing protein [Parashewanella curva]RLV59607.1 NYN domain-containing protein [Parashewanella curva]